MFAVGEISRIQDLILRFNKIFETGLKAYGLTRAINSNDKIKMCLMNLESYLHSLMRMQNQTDMGTSIGTSPLRMN